MSEVFENLMKDKLYKELLEQLPESEREVVIKALKKLVESFENKFLEPIKNVSKQ